MHPKYLNISNTFTGTGTLLIDTQAILDHILSRFDTKSPLPLRTIKHAVYYLIHNLHLTFSDITIVNVFAKNENCSCVNKCVFIENCDEVGDEVINKKNVYNIKSVEKNLQNLQIESKTDKNENLNNVERSQNTNGTKNQDNRISEENINKYCCYKDEIIENGYMYKFKLFNHSNCISENIFLKTMTEYIKLIAKQLPVRVYEFTDAQRLKIFIDDERIALVLCKKESDFMYYCLTNCIYVGIFDNFEFVLPDTFMFVYAPNDNDKELTEMNCFGSNKNKCDSACAKNQKIRKKTGTLNTTDIDYKSEYEAEDTFNLLNNAVDHNEQYSIELQQDEISSHSTNDGMIKNENFSDPGEDGLSVKLHTQLFYENALNNITHIECNFIRNFIKLGIDPIRDFDDIINENECLNEAKQVKNIEKSIESNSNCFDSNDQPTNNLHLEKNQSIDKSNINNDIFPKNTNDFENSQRNDNNNFDFRQKNHLEFNLPQYDFKILSHNQNVPISKEIEADLVLQNVNQKQKSNKSEQKLYQKNIFFLKNQADSLYGDDLKVTDLNKNTSVDMKVSSKQKKLMVENQKRIDEENKKKESIFLKSIFDRYKNSSNEIKKSIVKTEVSRNFSFNVRSKIMLLRIEFYYKEWEIEQRKEEINEGALVPCYLTCLELIDGILEEGSLDYDKEINFAIQKLIDCGFESTALEIIENINNFGTISKLNNEILKHENKKELCDEILDHQNCDTKENEFNDNCKVQSDQETSLICKSNVTKKIIENKKMHENKNLKTPTNKYKNKNKTKMCIDKGNFKFSVKANSKPNDRDIYFQLKFAGDKLKRTLHSQYDPRVLFTPDGWQITLLNLVDNNSSAVVCAPTSSGKTFICFYAIEKILRNSDKDVVIFCLPTKALVNQVMADVYARFSNKTYKNTKVLQGILMPDFQVDPYNCQVLITVPIMLESLLKSLEKLEKKGFNNTKKVRTNETVKSDVSKHIYSRFNKKSTPKTKPVEEVELLDFENQILKYNLRLKDIKYIIIDEVHKLGSDDMGVCIERVIHLSPCPLIILSATLGNLTGIYDWLKKIEEPKGRKVGLVEHTERYCEIKPYVYSKETFEVLENIKEELSDEEISDVNKRKKDVDLENVKVELSNEEINDVNENKKDIPLENDKEELSDVENDDMDESNKNSVSSDTKNSNNNKTIYVKKEVSKITSINPLFAFTYYRIKECGFSNDISFLPEELLDIYYSIFAVLKDEQKSLIQEMRPKKFFKSNIITKKDVKQYEKYIIEKLTKWIKEEKIDNDQLKEMYDYIVKDTNEAFKIMESRMGYNYQYLKNKTDNNYDCIQNEKNIKENNDNTKGEIKDGINNSKDIISYNSNDDIIVKDNTKVKNDKEDLVNTNFSNDQDSNRISFNNIKQTSRLDRNIDVLNDLNNKINELNTDVNNNVIKNCKIDVTNDCKNDVINESNNKLNDVTKDVTNKSNDDLKNKLNDVTNDCKNDVKNKTNDDLKNKSNDDLKNKLNDVTNESNNKLNDCKNDVKNKSNDDLKNKSNDEVKNKLNGVTHDLKSVQPVNIVETLTEDITDLVKLLKEKDLLPCIIFNPDRHICNELAKKVYYDLEADEMFDQVDVEKEKRKNKYLKEQKRIRDEKVLNKKEAWIDDSVFEAQNVDLLRNDKKNIKHCLFNSLHRKSDYELGEILRGLNNRVENVYLDLIYRGIGLHHNGVNKKLRHATENLFRSKHINVLFSTETLSLGINMPCRTVVFAGDSFIFDVINYKQMAGRAGRRGFDTLGNVIFYKMEKKKVQNLMVSSLSELKGKYGYINSSFMDCSEDYIKSMGKNCLFSLMYDNERCKGIDNTKDEKINIKGINAKEKNKGIYSTSDINDANAKDKKKSIKGIDAIEKNKGIYSTSDINDANAKEHNRKINDALNNKIKNGITNCDPCIKEVNKLDSSMRFNLGEFFTSTEKREKLIQLQLQNLEYLNFCVNGNNTCLTDLILSNKNYDPSIFVFALMLYQTSLRNCEIQEPLHFMNLVSHFFNVRYTLDKKHSLQPLKGDIMNFVNGVNKTYKKSMEIFYSKELNYLENKTKEPLFKIGSFFNTSGNKLKNSYLVEFYDRVNIHEIRENNKIDTGVLFYALMDLQKLFRSLIKIYETYKLDENVLKNLKVFVGVFDSKVNKIAA